MGVYYELGIVLGVFCLLIYLILVIMLWGKYYCYFDFINEELEVDVEFEFR